MRSLERSLAAKGWAKKDIAKAIKIIDHAKKNKHPKIKLLDRAIYWLSLLIAIIGNLIISIALVPFLLEPNNARLYMIIIILGISFGLLFELLVRKIEYLNAKHHIFLGTAIPVLAILNFAVILNKMESFIEISAKQNPLAIGAIYSISFMFPYIIYQFFLKNSTKNDCD